MRASRSRKNADNSPGAGSRACSMPFAAARVQRKSEGSDQAISATRCARSSAAKSALGSVGRVMMPKWLCMSAIGTRESAARAAAGPRASVGQRRTARRGA